MRSYSRWTRFAGGFCLLLLATLASGQNPPSPALPAEIPSEERIIYVPFASLDATFEKPDANVLVPYAEYQKLLKSWREAQVRGASPGALLTKADYEVRVQEGAARIVAKLHAQVQGKGWSELPVQFGSAALGTVKSSAQVLLRGTGNGQYALLFPDAGEYDVELELSLPVNQSPDGNVISLDCPAVALTSVDVQVPQASQKIEITPAVVITPSTDAAANTTRIRANVGAARQIVIRWRPEASLQPEMNLLTSVTNHTLVTLGEGLVHTDAWLNYEILRGELETIRIALPKSHRVLDVDAAGRVRSWKSSEQGENQVLTLELLSPVRDRLQVEVHTESPLAQAEVDIGGSQEGGRVMGIHALDVVREHGQIAIRQSEDLSLTVVEQQRLVRIEASEVAPQLQGKNTLVFKFYAPSYSLKISTKEVAPKLSVANQTRILFRDEELQLTHSFTFTIERTGIFELAFQVPENVIVDDVRGDRVKEFRVDAATRRMTVLLTERTTGNTSLSVRARLPLAGNANFNLPLLEPLNVEREVGTLQVFARESLEVRTDTAGVQAAQPLPIQASERQEDAVLTSAWTFSRRPVVIPVRTERKPTRLSATLATTVNVQPELTSVQSRLSWLVEYAGTDTFRVEVPESISGQVRIELAPGDAGSVPIKQKVAGTPANGRVVWTITTQRERLGRQVFLISYDLPPATTGAQSIQLIRPLGLVDANGATTTAISQLQGEVTFRKDQTLALKVEPGAPEIEQVDVRELALLPHDGLLAYRYFKDEAAPLALAVTQSKFEIQDVVSTVVPRALIEIVMGEDRSATYRARLQVKTTQRQRLLVCLPVNLEVLGAYVGDREVKLEKAETPVPAELGENWTPFWVNVARSESSDAPFLLTFQFLWTINPSLRDSSALRGELELPMPVLGPDEGGVVQEMKVVIWTPEGYTLIGNPRGFEWQGEDNLQPVFAKPVGDDVSQLDSWIALNGQPVASRGTQLPTTGRVPFVYSNLGGQPRISVVWWNRLTMTVMLSVTLLIMGWILLSTSWENKLSFLVILAFAATVYGIYDRGALWQALHAMRFGLLALLALWVLRGLFSWGRRNVRPATPPASPPVNPTPPPAPQPA